MTTRPRASLGRVLDDLGDTLLELIVGDGESATEIGGIAIYDALDEPVLDDGAIVLGVGLDADTAATLLPQLASRGAAALVLRASAAADPQLTAAARSAGVAVLSLAGGATWAQLATLLRSVLSEGEVRFGDAETLGGIPAGDLFTLANAIAALLDAPITIEDRNSRVLAFSGRQHEADPSRVETILGRQVPEKYSRLLTARGVFGELYRSPGPIFVEPLPLSDSEFTVPRVAMAVRAGDEILGSIWAAVHGPLDTERSRAMVDAATLVALHLLRVRAGADVGRRLRADLVATALEGGAGAADAMVRLGLDTHPVTVMAVALRDADGTPADTTRTAARDRLADALALHVSGVVPRSAAALVGDVVYGLLPATGDRPEATAARIAADFLGRIGSRFDAVIAIGPVAAHTQDLLTARSTVDRVLRVLRHGNGTQRVATLDDVFVASLLLELTDLAASRGDRLTGPLARLHDYDAAHGTELVRTLRAHLDFFGDVSAAADDLFVHPNTFRYRLRRVAEVGGINLADPDARFAAMLQLRIIDT